MSVGTGSDAESAVIDFIDSNPPPESYGIGNIKPESIENFMNGIEEGKYHAHIKLSGSRTKIWTFDVWEENGQWKAERIG